MLAITCDNVNNNNVLVDKLKKKILTFGGEASCIWCFAHVINLVAKSIITQFDLPCKCTQTTGHVMGLAKGGLTNAVADSSLAHWCTWCHSSCWHKENRLKGQGSISQTYSCLYPNSACNADILMVMLIVCADATTFMLIRETAFRTFWP